MASGRDHSKTTDPLEGDHEWEVARLKHELSKKCNSRHSNTEIEMARGRLLVERRVNAQYQEIARDALSEKFNPEHLPGGADTPNGRIDPEVRRRRDEYRNRMGAQVEK